MAVSPRTVRLPDGEAVAALGQGTWKMGAPGARKHEIAALRLGVDLGLTLIDTAEIYGDGAAEELLGEALADQRDEIFIVSKLAPQNLSRIAASCEGSLRRMRTDRIDLYLLHWRGGSLAEVVDGMEALKAAGRIRHWGVSNFDTADMQALTQAGGASCATDQVAYNAETRGAEFDLFPWMAARAMPVMAYSPVGKGPLLDHPALAEVAAGHGVAPAAVALAWTLRRGDVIAIPKAADPDHIRQNRAALDLEFGADDLAVLDAGFPPPTYKVPLKLL